MGFVNKFRRIDTVSFPNPKLFVDFADKVPSSKLYFLPYSPHDFLFPLVKLESEFELFLLNDELTLLLSKFDDIIVPSAIQIDFSPVLI